MMHVLGINEWIVWYQTSVQLYAKTQGVLYIYVNSVSSRTCMGWDLNFDPQLLEDVAAGESVV